MDNEAVTRAVDIRLVGLETVRQEYVTIIMGTVGPPAGPAGQQVPDGIQLTFGRHELPIFLQPNQEARDAALAAVQSIDVTVTSRLVMSRERAQELASLLETLLAQSQALELAATRDVEPGT